MTHLSADLLAWIPFINPIELPVRLRLWMFLPLAACIAVVYRATRARTTEGLLRRAAVTWINVVVGMWLLALAALGLHEAVLRLGS